MDKYYWDILPREDARRLINILVKQLGEQNISYGDQKHAIDSVRGSLDDLEAIREIIPKAAGIGTYVHKTASTVTSACISRAVDVTDIPFVTADVGRLKGCLRRSVGDARLDDVITNVGGTLQRAILIFKSATGK